MKIDVSLCPAPFALDVTCRPSSVKVGLLDVRPPSRVSVSLRGPCRIAVALVTMSLVLGAFAQPFSGVDVDFVVASPITPHELDDMYNFIELSGRYVMTADGRIFEVKED